MTLDQLKKLVRLANNNPNDHEANAAARKVCRTLEENKFSLVGGEQKTFWDDIIQSKPATRAPRSNPYTAPWTNPYDKPHNKPPFYIICPKCRTKSYDAAKGVCTNSFCEDWTCQCGKKLGFRPRAGKCLECQLNEVNK